MNNGGSAFPWTRNRHPQEALNSVCAGPGMSLRDYFAAQAISGACAGKCPDETSLPFHARKAYALADSMLAERAK